MFETPESSSDLKARQRLVKPLLVAPVWPIRVLAPNWPFTSSQGCCTGPGQPRRPRLPRPVCLLCVQRKKPTLNGSKSTCCTFSQVVGQKLFRTGSCHHRFQVKPLFISRSLLIVFFFFWSKLPVLSEIWECRHVSVSACRESCSRKTNNRPLSAGFNLPRLASAAHSWLLCFRLQIPEGSPDGLKPADQPNGWDRTYWNVLPVPPLPHLSWRTKLPFIHARISDRPENRLLSLWDRGWMGVSSSLLFLNTKLSVKTCKGFTVSPRCTGDI